MSSKPWRQEKKEAVKNFRRAARNSICELSKSVYIKFGPLKRALDHAVCDEHSNIIAAFPNEELAREYQEMRGLEFRDGEWRPPF